MLEADIRPVAEASGAETLAEIDSEADRRECIRRWNGLAIADTARAALAQ